MSNIKFLFEELLKETTDDTTAINLLKKIEAILAIESDNNTDESITDVLLSQGVAINPKLAAQCFTDYLRTHRFMLGTYQCVLQQRNQGKKPIRILYAGTGPYATIVLPLLYLFSEEEISITTIEINNNSYTAANRLIRKLKKEEYFDSTLLTDAITYTPNREFDIIISETMDKALTREPQLAIFSNLINYLSPSGQLIPECIKVDLTASSIYLEKDVPYYCFDDKETRQVNHKHRQFIDNVIAADRHFFETQTLIPNQSLFLKTVKTNHIKENLNELIFTTEVIVFGNVALLEDDSTLTKKYICYSFADMNKGKEFDIHYLNNDSPRIALTPKN